MGKRRMRLLHEIGQKNNIEIELFGVDGRADRRKEAEDQAEELGFSVKAYESLESATQKNDIDCAVISTSPLSHAAIIAECIEYNLNVFTELNLVTTGYDENTFEASKRGLTLFMSSTPIYRDEMRYITKKVRAFDGILNYTYHVGQYLPDWHPWESYKDFFIGDKRTNGCRELFAVELPWMIRAFGDIESVEVITSRQTALDIDFNDCYNVIIRHKTGHTGVLTVDVVSRPAVRNMRVVGEHFFLSWDGSPNGIKEYDEETKELKDIILYEDFEHREGYNHTIIENMYVNELMDFLSVLKGEKEAEYSFKKDKEVLELIDRIEDCQ